jgi:hypothetical protein
VSHVLPRRPGLGIYEALQMMLLGLLLGSLILARIFRFEWYWYLIIVVLWLLGALAMS